MQQKLEIFCFCLPFIEEKNLLPLSIAFWSITACPGRPGSRHRSRKGRSGARRCCLGALELRSLLLDLLGGFMDECSFVFPFGPFFFRFVKLTNTKTLRDLVLTGLSRWISKRWDFGSFKAETSGLLNCEIFGLAAFRCWAHNLKCSNH